MNDREIFGLPTPDELAKRWAADRRREKVGMCVAVLAVLALVSLVALGVVLVGRASCSRSWEGSGMRSKWRGFIVGCVVEVKPGMWIPEERVRLLGDE